MKGTAKRRQRKGPAAQIAVVEKPTPIGRRVVANQRRPFGFVRARTPSQKKTNPLISERDEMKNTSLLGFTDSTGSKLI